MPITKRKKKYFERKPPFPILLGCTLTLTTLISIMLWCVCAVHLGVWSTSRCHVLRISSSQNSQTRDKARMELKLTSWSVLLYAPTASQDKATECHWAKTGFGKESLRSQLIYWDIRHSLNLNTSQQKGFKVFKWNIFERALPIQIYVWI